MIGAVDHDRDGRQDKMEGLGRGIKIEDIDDDVHPRARVKCSGAAATPIHAMLNDDPHAGVENSESNIVYKAL
jgi:hypothetical protein